MPIDPFEDPEVAAFLREAVDELYPKIQKSAFVLSIVTESKPDPKVCMEIGAAVMFDKPIVVLATSGSKVPDVLRRLAFDVVEVDLTSGDGREETAETIRRLLENLDERGNEGGEVTDSHD